MAGDNLVYDQLVRKPVHWNAEKLGSQIKEKDVKTIESMRRNSTEFKSVSEIKQKQFSPLKKGLAISNKDLIRQL